MKKYILIWLSSVLLVSCSTTDSLSPEPKMDDEWEYIYKTYAPNGNVVNTTSVLIDSSSKYSYNGDYVWYENGLYLTPYFPFGRCRMNEDGLYFLITTTNRSFPVCVYRYPSFAGEINHINNEEAYIFNWNIRTLSTTGNIDVPYGSFSSANIYEITYPSSPKEMVWFNDSVWMIKYERWDSTDANGYYKRSSFELVNYEAH